MGTCASYQGDLAAAIYDDMSTEARARLDQHLAQCPACRDEALALRAFSASLPLLQTEFTGDLRPVLRAEIACGASPRRHFPRFLWVPLAASLVIAAAAFFAALPQSSDPAGLPPLVQDAGDVARPATLLAQEARVLASAGNYVAARELLASSRDVLPSDLGILQLALADIEFEHGQRYAEAFAAYDLLKRQHPEVWAQSPAETKDRYDLLAETRDEAYQPLYALDAADSFDRLEQVLARYPDRQLVAYRAVERMVEAVGAESAPDAHQRVAALDAVRTRCTEPLAVAQLSIALGDLYWKGLKDPVRARPLYENAAGVEHMVLAQRAKAAIGELDALPRP